MVPHSPKLGTIPKAVGLSSKRVLLGALSLIALASVACLVYIAAFLRRFGSSWPEMFCSDPGPAYFQILILVPVLVAVGACFFAVSVTNQSGLTYASTGALFIMCSMWCLRLTFSVVSSLREAQYDTRCLHMRHWFSSTPLLDAFTSAAGGYATVVLLFAIVLRVFVRLWRPN